MIMLGICTAPAPRSDQAGLLDHGSMERSIALINAHLFTTQVIQYSSMDHYKKIQSHYYEDPCGVNELRITGTGKSHDLCTKVTHRLKVLTRHCIIL